MKHRISRIEPLPAAKLIAAVSGVIAFVVMAVMGVVPILQINEGARTREGMLAVAGMAIGMPLIYALASFVLTRIGTGVYNAVAGRIGGIAIDLDTAL